MFVEFGGLVDHLPAWLMVLFRLTGVFILAPMLGSVTIPRQVKVLLVLSLSFCVYPMLLEPTRASATFVGSVVANGFSLWTLIPTVGLELLLGVAVGYAASLPLVGVQLGGRMIDQQMGLGLAGVINPEMDAQSGVVGEFFFIMAVAIFALMGGHRVMFATLIGSFDRVPLGGFTDFAGLVDLMIALMVIMYELAIRIAAPLLCLIFLQTVALGFIARTVPQMNILSVGFVLRILVGAGFLAIFVSVGGAAYAQSLQRVLRLVWGFFSM